MRTVTMEGRSFHRALLFAFALTACLGAESVQAAAPLEFADHGKSVRSLDSAEIRKLAPPTTKKIFEPHEEAEIEFQALPLVPVLDAVYGQKWRESEQILFRCADGYRAPVPTERIAHHWAGLAFDRAGGFRIAEKSPTKQIELAPYFLIWDTLSDPAMKAEGKTGWPYQIVGLDLISYAALYPQLVPGPGASAAVRAGAGHFQKYCVSCHAIQGQGGKVGPELSDPVNVTEYYQKAWLKKWILDPSTVRKGTAMPIAIPLDLAHRSRVADEIIAYLARFRR